jgi:hypothetical protein
MRNIAVSVITWYLSQCPNQLFQMVQESLHQELGNEKESKWGFASMQD